MSKNINIDILLTAAEETLKSGECTPMLIVSFTKSGEPVEGVVLLPMPPHGMDRGTLMWRLGANMQSGMPNLTEVAFCADTWVAELAPEDTCGIRPGSIADMPSAEEALAITAYDLETGNTRDIIRRYKRDVTLERTKIKFGKIERSENKTVPTLLLYLESGYKGDSAGEAHSKVTIAHEKMKERIREKTEKKSV